MNFDPRQWNCLCDMCPARDLVPVPPEGNLNTALLGIVGDAPGFQEERLRRPMVGPAGEKLRDILKAAKLTRADVWITQSVLCRLEVPGMIGVKKYDLPTYLAWFRATNRRLKKEKKPLLANPFDCCAPRLWSELQMLERAALKRGQPNGAVVMPLGNQALAAVVQKKKIMRWRGSPIPLQVPGFNYGGSNVP